MHNSLNVKSGILFNIALFIAFLIGIAVRIYHLFIIGFSVPFDLGGLFYQISIEIIKNGFLLPVTIPYYYPGGLPFAYPPIPFYIQAAIIKLFSPSMFITVNALPPLFSIMSLFAFFFLARKFIKNEWGVIAAVFTFAILSIAFTEQIEAQGLSESLGTLSLILYTFSLLWAEEKKQKRYWIVPGLFLGLCILSSPGSIIGSILISILYLGLSIFYSIKYRNINFLLNFSIVGIVGLIVSSPYWYTVISYHGIGIFLNSFTNQNTGNLNRILRMFLHLSFLSASPFWNILFCFGLLFAIIKRNYLLLLFSAVLIPIPRELWIMSIPASLIIGNGIGYLLDLSHLIPGEPIKFFKVALTGLILIISLNDARIGVSELIDNRIYDISKNQINDLIQINKSNLIPSDQYVIVVGNWGLIEWSPALIKREVINNHFGLEWMPNQGNRYSLSTKLGKIDNPDEIIKEIQGIFKETTKIYLIADKKYMTKLYKNRNGNNETFKSIQEYKELGLGIITPKY